MASSVESQGLNIDPKEFECSICLELLDDPRTLPCGHWFCGPSKDCLRGQTFSSGAIECAICRTLHSNIVIKDLPPNYSIRSILDTLRSQPEAPPTPVTPSKPNLLDFDTQISECQIHKKNLLSYYCEDCEQLLCQDCWADHNSEHKVVLVQLKRKKLLSELLESFGFEDTIQHYKKLSDDNSRRKAILRDLVKHADRLSSHLNVRSEEVETLQKMADDLKNKNPTCDEKFCKELMEKLTKESESGEDVQIKTSFQSFKADCENKYLSLMNTFVSSEKILSEQASTGVVKKKTQSRSKKRPEEKSSLERDLKSAVKSSSGPSSGDCKNANSNNDRPATSRATPISSMFLSEEYSEEEFEDEDDDVSESGSAASTSVLNSGDGNRGAHANRNRRGKRGGGVSGSRGKCRSEVGVRGAVPIPRGGPRFPRGNPNLGLRMPPPLIAQSAPGPRMGLASHRPLIATDVPIRINGCLVFRRGNLMDSPYSLAIGVRENCDFDVGLPLAIGKKFKPIPELFKKAKKRPGQAFVFEDHRINPKRFIYCLVIKEQNWVGKPYSALLENCFRALKEHAQKNNICNISMPLIGHAYGDDLSVDLVEVILKNIFSPNITINIYN